MKSIVWVWLIATFLLFWLLVTTMGFPGLVAYSVHFVRIAISIGVLWVFIPALPYIFNTVPPPGRDYLLAGIVLTWVSNFSFSLWNEAGRQWQVDTSIFSSPVAGFFSLVVACGGVFLLLAPSTDKPKTRYWALAAGLIGAMLLVVVAPYFR